MNADLEKIAAQFTFSKGTTGGKVVGGKLPTPTKVSGGSGSGGTTPPAKTTPPAGGAGTTPPPAQQQTPPAQQQPKTEKQPNPTVEAAKKDAKQVAGKATDWANKNLGGAANAVEKSNLGQQFLNSKTGQNFQKSRVGKWAMNNKGAAVGLAGAGLAAGGLAIGAAIKRHKEKKKMKEQAQMNAQAMGKSAMEDFTMYEDIGMQLEKIASKAMNDKEYTKARRKDAAAAFRAGGLRGQSPSKADQLFGKVTGFGGDQHDWRVALKEMRDSQSFETPAEERKAARRELAKQDAKRAGTVAAGAGLAAGGTIAALKLKKHLKKKKEEQEKAALDAAVEYLMEKEASAPALPGRSLKGRMYEAGTAIRNAAGFSDEDKAAVAHWKKFGSHYKHAPAALKEMRKPYGKRAAAAGIGAGAAAAVAGGSIALKKALAKHKKKKEQE